jgi:mono/diheme cytochrome c family protein
VKKILKVLGILVGIVAVLVIGGLIYISSAYPDVSDAPDITVEITPARLERGEYLATHVSVCMDCHSTRDWSHFAGPPVAGTYGEGGEEFNESMGFPGTFVAPNITPVALSSWTDGEIYRALTAGVSRDGRPLFPVMPWPLLGTLDREDIYSIIAYIRTLPPVEKQNPVSSANFPMNFIMKMMPKDATPGTRPDPSDHLAYGKYMTTAAGCQDCHTPMEKGEYVEGMMFAGGFEFRFPDGSIVHSMNITPDKETGIGNWTKDMFIARFKSYVDSSYTPPQVAPGEFNTPMPWTMYGGMKEEDLGAIFDYLHSLTPVSHRVERFIPPGSQASEAGM